MAALVVLSLMLILEPLIFGTNRLVQRWRRSARRDQAEEHALVVAPGLDQESRLATDLVAGGIDATTYCVEMEAIARAEDLRSPLLVPGDGGSDAS